jgi:hypothetical protein
MRSPALAVAICVASIVACTGAVGGTDVMSTTTTTTGDSGTSTCTSGLVWTGGNHGSPSMHPGHACVDCHSREDAPQWTIAGTVYPSLHEEDDCDGTRGGLKVVVTDATGRSLTLAVNNAGNFYTNQSVTFPIHAKVVNAATGAETAMTDAQSSGDCNGCHTATGASSAPGRITAP